MFALARIVQELFLKVLKSGHRLTLRGGALSKVASEFRKVLLTRDRFSLTCTNFRRLVK